MAKLKSNNSKFYDVSGLELFIACRDFWLKVRPIFVEYDLWELDKIELKYIEMIEKESGKTIEEILAK